MSDFPPMSLQIKPVQAQQPDPLQTLNQLMQIQGHMLDNTKKMNEQRSLMDLGQIIATTDPENQAEAIARSRAAIYNPQAVHSFIESKKSIVDIARERLAQTNTGINNWGHDMAQLMSDPDISPERAQALIMNRAAAYTDPVARQKYLDTARSITQSIFADWPSREEQLRDPAALSRAQEKAKQRIDGQVAASVGTWEAIREATRGGTVSPEEGIFYRNPLGRGPPQQLNPATQPSPLVPPNAAPAPVAPVTISPLSGMAVPAEAAQANALSPPGAPDAAAPPPISIEPLAGQAAPAGAPAGAEVGSGQSMPPPAAAAPAAQPPYVPQEPGVAPPINQRTGLPVWGHGADTYSEIAPWGGPTKIALSDGRLLSNVPLTGKAGGEPINRRASGALVYDEPTSALIKEKSAEYGKEAIVNDNNHKLMGQITQMRDNFSRLHQIGGWAEPGRYMEQKAQLFGLMKDIGNTLGIDLGQKDPNKLTAEMIYQDINKIAIQMGYAATSQAFPGQREAMQTIQTTLGMVPNGAMSFKGAMFVMRGMESMAQRMIDQYTFKGEFAKANRGNLIGWDTEFNKQHSVNELTSGVSAEFGIGPEKFGHGRIGAERARNAYNRGYITKEEFSALANEK